MKNARPYTAIIEQDTATGFYVAYIPDLPGAHTQAKTLEELKTNLAEVVELVLEEKTNKKPESRFVGTQLVSVWSRMGSNLPVIKPKEVIAVLDKLGFRMVRQRGSHQQYRHADGRATTVPVHGSRDLSPILLRQICKDILITPEEFLRNK